MPSLVCAEANHARAVATLVPTVPSVARDVASLARSLDIHTQVHTYTVSRGRWNT